ncbi:unnamed protein product, partial [Staurois parvus]
GVPVRPPFAAVSIAKTPPCAIFSSAPSHCWWVPFCHRVLRMSSPYAASLHRHTVASTLLFVVGTVTLAGK